MKKRVVIIGGGTAGLILALGFSKKNFDVTLLYRPSGPEENSALICPQLVIDFLEKLAPGISAGLANAGAIRRSHGDLLRRKFPHTRFPNPGDLSFLFLSRKLLISELTFIARNLGMNFVSDRVTGLTMEGGVVREVQGVADSYRGDFIFDCTGSATARAGWMESSENISTAGAEEEIFQRLYQSENEVPLLLRSLPGARGGIYPVEGKQFFVNLSFPKGTTAADIEDLSRNFIGLIGGAEILAKATPIDEWWTLSRRSYRSDFYESSGAHVENFFPVGEGILSSLPVYGRGISLVVLQVSTLLESVTEESSADEVKSALVDGFREAEEKWKEVSGDERSPLKNPVRKWAHELLERNPEAYECFLSFYQLRLSPPELFLGLIKARFLKAE